MRDHTAQVDTIEEQQLNGYNWGVAAEKSKAACTYYRTE